MNGIYTDKENLKVVFSYLIFNVASINKKYGSLSKFINDFNLGGLTNGKLYTIAEMAQPHNRLYDLIYENLKWIGFKEKEDFVFGIEHLTRGLNGYGTVRINREIPELKNINWLGSYITHNGNYVWYVDGAKKNSFLSYQDNILEGTPPKLYYQKLLTVYFKHLRSPLLNLKYKVTEVDDHYVYFSNIDTPYINGIRRSTLERYKKRKTLGNR
ncbi:hypothetical protein N9M71_03020 [Winogradskyella sp.]|nr:hypothetical protein [Winogradskyella sp.]